MRYRCVGFGRVVAGSDHPLKLRQVIALRKTEGGWGQVFHRLHNEGLVDAKNLGQVVRCARARPVMIATAGNRTEDVAAVCRGAGWSTARGAQSAGAGGRSERGTQVAAALHGRGHGAGVAITSAGNGTHAGGRTAVSSGGGNGNHEYGGHKR